MFYFFYKGLNSHREQGEVAFEETPNSRKFLEGLANTSAEELKDFRLSKSLRPLSFDDKESLTGLTHLQWVAGVTGLLDYIPPWEITQRYI